MVGNNKGAVAHTVGGNPGTQVAGVDMGNIPEAVGHSRWVGFVLGTGQPLVVADIQGKQGREHHLEMTHIHQGGKGNTLVGEVAHLDTCKTRLVKY